MRSFYFYGIILLLVIIIGIWIYYYINFKIHHQLLQIEDEQNEIEGKLVNLKSRLIAVDKRTDRVFNYLVEQIGILKAII